MCCRVVLLESTSLASESIGEQTGMAYISVNSWVKRFESEGIKSLEPRPSSSCKPVISYSNGGKSYVPP